MKLVLQFLLFTIFIFQLSSNVQALPLVNAQLMSPFAQIVVTPTIDPYHLFNNINDYYTTDEKLQKLALQEVSLLLNGVKTCLNSNGKNQKIVKNAIETIISRLPEISIYRSNLLNTTAQGRFGASNLMDHKIIINSNYPQWTDRGITQVFYLHEMLEALGYNDRWYHLTGTFWSTYQLCNTQLDKNNPYFIERLQSEEFALSFLKAFKIIQYKSDQAPSITKSSFFLAGGGVTGVDSGGDPFVAFFQANLFEQALASELLSKDDHSFEKSLWLSLMNIKMEGYPGLPWFNKNNFQNIDKETKSADYISYLNSVQQKLQNDKNGLELLNNQTLFFGILDEKNAVIYVDTQILEWMFNKLNFKLERNKFVLNTLKALLSGMNFQTRELDPKRIHSFNDEDKE